MLSNQTYPQNQLRGGTRELAYCGPKPVRFLNFLIARRYGMLEGELEPAKALLVGSVMVNPHVCVQTEGNQRVILVHGIIFLIIPAKIAPPKPTTCGRRANTRMTRKRLC